jgi:hypothetical protein
MSICEVVIQVLRAKFELLTTRWTVPIVRGPEQPAKDSEAFPRSSDRNP